VHENELRGAAVALDRSRAASGELEGAPRRCPLPLFSERRMIGGERRELKIHVHWFKTQHKCANVVFHSLIALPPTDLSMSRAIVLLLAASACALSDPRPGSFHQSGL
jgi:hypothetical protein